MDIIFDVWTAYSDSESITITWPGPETTLSAAMVMAVRFGFYDPASEYFYTPASIIRAKLDA